MKRVIYHPGTGTSLAVDECVPAMEDDDGNITIREYEMYTVHSKEPYSERRAIESLYSYIDGAIEIVEEWPLDGLQGDPFGEPPDLTLRALCDNLGVSYRLVTLRLEQFDRENK